MREADFPRMILCITKILMPRAWSEFDGQSCVTSLLCVYDELGRLEVVRPALTYNMFPPTFSADTRISLASYFVIADRQALREDMPISAENRIVAAAKNFLLLSSNTAYDDADVPHRLFC